LFLHAHGLPHQSNPEGKEYGGQDKDTDFLGSVRALQDLKIVLQHADLGLLVSVRSRFFVAQAGMDLSQIQSAAFRRPSVGAGFMRQS
jgi:hypothetical protein